MGWKEDCDGWIMANQKWEANITMYGKCDSYKTWMFEIPTAEVSQTIFYGIFFVFVYKQSNSWAKR